MRLRRRTQLLLAAATLVLSACSGVDEGPSASVATDTAATDPAPTRDESSPTASRDGDRGGRVIAIPDDFPLTAGWPRRTGEPGYAGLTGPSRSLPALEIAPCGVRANDPNSTDRLRAEWEDAEDFRSRQLTTFGSEAAAHSALLAIVDAYRSCPDTESAGDPAVSYYLLEETEYGDESWSVAETSTYDGWMTTSLVVSHFVRVGTALLANTNDGEGGAGPPGTIERHVTRSAIEAEQVIAAMCVFTTAGC